MKRRRPAPTRDLFRNVVELAAVTADDKDKNPRWMQIARTGLWKGYRASRTIEFTVQTFTTIIANFHDHPTYKAAAKGKGTTDVVPCDFNHASEMDPSEGALPVVGAPAQAWIQELELRPTADGKTGLWAFTRLLEPVATYIKEGKIKWTSVTVWPNAVDPESAKEIGPLLTSVAFTNQPFIEGMEPIAASYSIGGKYFDPASDAVDAFMQLRKLFGLSQTSAIGDLLAEIGKLRMWLSSGTVPMGVDADELVSCMRTILGLPALSNTDDVFAELDKLLPALIDQEALEATETGPDMPTENTSASVGVSAAPLKRNSHMTLDPKLLVTLASTFGIVANTEDAILATAKDLATDSRHLRTLFKALNVSDADGAATALATLFSSKKELEELKPKFEALTKRLDEVDTKEAEAEIALVLAEHKLPDSMKPVLLDYRKRNVEAFRKQFPLTPADKQHLTRTVFASNDGAQLGSAGTGGDKPGANDRSTGGAPDVDAYPGRNRIEKCMSFIRGTVAGAKDWTHEQVHEQACELNRRLGPPASRAAARA